MTLENSVGPDDTACYEPSHLALLYLQRCLHWYVGTKGLMQPFVSCDLVVWKHSLNELQCVIVLIMHIYKFL